MIVKTEKKEIPIEECKCGDIIAQEVYSRQGLLLVNPGVVVNDELLKKLKNLGVFSLYVYPLVENEVPLQDKDSYQTFVNNYEQDVSQIKTIINDLAKGKELDVHTVQNITDHIFEEINERDNIISCLSTLKAFDEYTYNHSINVSLYSMLIGHWLEMPENKIKECIIAGLLHDIGKSYTPDEILNKRGKLTPEEFEIIKLHPTHGYEIAKKSKEFPESILNAILMHHEREDGTGYPFGLTGDRLNILAKIVAVADVYDALTSERVYKKRITPFETFKIIETTGLGYYDTVVLLTFLRNIANYYIGTEVLLNMGEQGKIVHVVPHNISNPIICVNGRYIDTSREKDIKIVSLLN